MDSFIQVAELLFMPLVRDTQEIVCWRLHVDIVRFLQRESFTSQDLEKLGSMILRWKRMMVELYGDVKDQRKTKTRKTKKAKKNETGATAESDDTANVSFNFPNFEVCEHWPELIRFLGPPWFQDTRLWEQRHLSAKTTARRTNQQATERAVLIKVTTPHARTHAHNAHVSPHAQRTQCAHNAHTVTKLTFYGVQTHEKDAVDRHHFYEHGEFLSEEREVVGRQPYSLTTVGKVVTDLTAGQMRMLQLAVDRECGSGTRIGRMTTHHSAHYFGHCLRAQNAVVVRVPEKDDEVCILPFPLFLHVLTHLLRRLHSALMISTDAYSCQLSHDGVSLSDELHASYESTVAARTRHGWNSNWATRGRWKAASFSSRWVSSAITFPLGGTAGPWPSASAWSHGTGCLFSISTTTAQYGISGMHGPSQGECDIEQVQTPTLAPINSAALTTGAFLVCWRR
jgi:hypothetical protein